MTEAEKPIEAPKAEETAKTKPRPRPRHKPKIYRTDKIHPHVPVVHFEMCGFTDPKYIFDENSPGYKSEYDIMEFDMVDTEEQPIRGHIAYEDMLLQKMMALLEERREEFISYQAGIQNDSKLWLSELRRFWTNFRKHIVELEDREFYDDYLAIIDKVSKKKMKECIKFNWVNIQPFQLMELILALEAVGYIKYDSARHEHNEMIEAVAASFGFEFSKLDNIKKSVIGRKRDKVVFLKDMVAELEKHLQELEKKYSR